MTVGEAIRYLRENPVVGINKARKETGLSHQLLKKLAKGTGTRLVYHYERAGFCKKAPEACENCPFEDCTNFDPPNDAETERVVSVLKERKKEEKA